MRTDLSQLRLRDPGTGDQDGTTGLVEVLHIISESLRWDEADSLAESLTPQGSVSTN